MYALSFRFLKPLRRVVHRPSYRLTLLPSFLIVSALSGQSVDERRQIDAFRDTLQLVTDTMALRERQALMLRAAARSRSEPFYHLYLGALSLRQGELGGPTHLDEAAAEFRWAAMLAPTWSYAWFGVGSAELALGSQLSSGGPEDSRRVSLAREAYSRGARAFARAVSIEPSLAVRLERLARSAIRDGSRDRAIAVREGLSFPGKPRSPRRLLALGRVERDLGDSGALATFAEYLRSGDNRALGQLELGRTQLSLGDPSGAMRYLAAAAENDSTTVAELRSDLAFLATEMELAEFDRRSGLARADFLRRFWTGRDRLGLRADGDRLVEHFRRLAVARERYLIVGEDGVDRFDDRGRVYVRQGEPSDWVTLAVPGVEPNESWRYRRDRRAGGDLVLHFVARHDPRDFRLVESVWDIATGRNGTTSGGSAPVVRRGIAELMRSRAPIDPLYREVPVRARQLTELQTRERALGRRGKLVALGSDAFPLSIARCDGLWGQLLVMGGTGTSSVLQLVFLASRPGGALPPTARIRLIALDTAGNVVASADSIVALDSTGAGRFTIPVRPGRVITHAALQLGPAGLDIGIDTLRVPSPGSRDLGLGTLLIGSDDGSVVVPLASGGEFRLSTNNGVSRNGILSLGTEVFGLALTEKARMQVLVSLDTESSDRRKWRSLRLSEADRSVMRDRNRGPIATWRASISLRGLEPGRYRVAVVTTAGPGKSARQEGEVQVRRQ